MGYSVLLRLKDGAILDIWTDEHYHPGCPTCDYGSQYINEFKITLTKYIVQCKIAQECEYRFSSGDLMKAILPAVPQIMQMTEKEFTEWFKENVIYSKDWMRVREFFHECKVRYEVKER